MLPALFVSCSVCRFVSLFAFLFFFCLKLPVPKLSPKRQSEILFLTVLHPGLQISGLGILNFLDLGILGFGDSGKNKFCSPVLVVAVLACRLLNFREKHVPGILNMPKCQQVSKLIKTCQNE